MCGPKRSKKENASAAQDRVDADLARSDAAAERSKTKRDEISEALSGRETKMGGRGGKGRRSLFNSAGGGGFLGRFG